MKIEKNRLFVSVKSKRNKAELTVGRVRKYYGVLGGIQIHEDGDWWHLTFALKFMCVYATLSFRWRIFGEGYDRKDVYTG